MGLQSYTRVVSLLPKMQQGLSCTVPKAKVTQMEKNDFDQIVTKLHEINGVIKELDPAIREQAFDLLLSYVDAKGAKITRKPKDSDETNGSATTEDQPLISEEKAATFLSEYAVGKPADNVKAIGALIFSEYGSSQFTPADVNRIADETGVMVPDRVDVTLQGASHNKNRLFTKVRSGVYKPTIHGQKYFQEFYGVTKGTRKMSDGGD